MSHRTCAVLLLIVVTTVATFAADVKQTGQGSMVIVFKDGHRQTIRMSDVSRIEFASPETSTRSVPQPSNSLLPTRNHFTGKWEVGDGYGNKFLITLREDGQAEKSVGATHGTWTVVDGEARITWDDGWHDAIRKVGSKHEKLAYSPGKSFSEKPSNVTDARATEPKPL